MADKLKVGVIGVGALGRHHARLYAESANAAAPYLKDISHAMTSERDVSIMWNRHIKSLGLIYDRILKAYTPGS